MNHWTIITAHSGAENTHDNTLESIRVLAEIGADALEIDVSLQDGRLVLSHEAPEAGQSCAALKECFLEIARHAGLWVNVDLKASDIVEGVIECAESCGIKERILFTGDLLSPRDFEAARKVGIPVWYNHTQVAAGTDLLQGASDAGYEVLNVNYRLATVDMLRSTPERLSLWTVNEESALRELLMAGVRNITTRIPLTAMRLREEIQNKMSIGR